MTKLQATSSLDTVATTRWDAIVVGAGCAGAVAARQIALSGAKTLLVDKSTFPRYKVCGCCLGQPVQNSLMSIGLGHILESTGAVLAKQLTCASQGRSVSIALPNYRILSREQFDTALIAAAIAAGSEFLPGVSALASSAEGNGRTVTLFSSECKQDVHAKVVVIANGLGSRLLRGTEANPLPVSQDSRIGAGAVWNEAPEFYGAGTIYMACGAGGYVGACRLEDGRLTLAAAFDPDFIKGSGGIERAASQVLQEAGFPRLETPATIPWRGTPALTRVTGAVSAHRAFVIGDAAGYVEPFTGEGMKWAVTSGIAVTPIVARAIDAYEENLGLQWSDVHRRLISERTGACKMLSRALRRPNLVSMAIRCVSALPILASPFVRHLNQHDSIQKEVRL